MQKSFPHHDIINQWYSLLSEQSMWGNVQVHLSGAKLYLEVHRSVLDLHNDIVVEQSIQRLEGEVRLLGALLPLPCASSRTQSQSL